MKLVQVATTDRRQCGIGLFAEKLERQWAGPDLAIETVDRWPVDVKAADAVLLQHHDELFDRETLARQMAACPVPVVLFGHDPEGRAIQEHADGLVAMVPDLFAETTLPSLVFPHPAWTPRRLDDRSALRREVGLPVDRYVVGAHGYLKFERRFEVVVEALVDDARLGSVVVELLTSPWLHDSPGLLERFAAIERRAPERFRHHHGFLDAEALNRRLQACDLLWCWTDAPSSAYASGVIADQYASGTRVVAADKLQHRPVLDLPNVVAAPDDLDGFVERLRAEVRRADRRRHDPEPVAWSHARADFAALLQRVVSTAGAGSG